MNISADCTKKQSDAAVAVISSTETSLLVTAWCLIAT